MYLGAALVVCTVLVVQYCIIFVCLLPFVRKPTIVLFSAPFVVALRDRRAGQVPDRERALDPRREEKTCHRLIPPSPPLPWGGVLGDLVLGGTPGCHLSLGH